jgi:hypothetical protein
MTFINQDELDLRAQAIRENLVGMIHDRNNATPRHLQVELGPSDVSHPCTRKLAYGLLQVERCNPEFDILPSLIGTAVHAWLDTAVTHANNQLGRVRYLAETRVSPASWLQGSCDLFDQEEGIICDWKVLGNSSFKRYKKSMNPAYKTQVNLYGLGFENAGHKVNYVSVMMIPRAGLLSGAYLWLEPYDRSVAEAALERRNNALTLIQDLDIKNNPQLFELLEKSGPSCLFCAQFAPNPTSPLQCGGVDDD